MPDSPGIPKKKTTSSITLLSGTTVNVIEIEYENGFKEITESIIQSNK